MFSDKVRLKHHGLRGLVSKGYLKGDKEIWIDQIAGMQWREPGNLWLGHLQFEVVGGVSSTKIASQDENAVMFDITRRAAFEQVKLTVERLMRDQRQQKVAPTGQQQTDIPDSIAKLAALRDSGVLTPEEFERKKNELLERL